MQSSDVVSNPELPQTSTQTTPIMPKTKKRKAPTASRVNKNSKNPKNEMSKFKNPLIPGFPKRYLAFQKTRIPKTDLVKTRYQTACNESHFKAPG